MRQKTLTKLVLLITLLAWSITPLQAAPVPLIDGDGDDSGWTVESGGATLDLLSSDIIDVDLAAKTVTITVAKDFGPYEEILGQIDFPVGSLTFTEVDVNADKIDKIVILSETIDNNTGVAWDGFSWQVLTTAAAEFNTAESSGWDEPSFSSWVFQTNHKLLASNGAVANGATFSPGDNLVIDIHLDASDSPLAITLKQHVVPEPATLSVLVLGGVFAAGRRLRKR